MSDRRSFLTGLASLPLVGGGVKILGRPTAAAVVPTTGLLQNYEAWLGWERHRLQSEMWGREVADANVGFLRVNVPAEQWHNPWRDEDSPCPSPATRAALVLATVGCPLDGGLYGNAAVVKRERA